MTHRKNWFWLLAPAVALSSCDGGGAREDWGEGENLYVQATETLTDGLYDADCNFVTTLLFDYAVYSESMTNARLRELASSRFRPVLDYMSRKLCNEYGINGDLESYVAEAFAYSPAAECLNGTPLLQALVEQSADVTALLEAANAERSADGLEPIIVADYANSVTRGPSTIVFFPGWPGRPELDQWIQVQRTLNQIFFISLEPRGDGTYSSFVHSRPLTTSEGTPTIGGSALGSLAGDSCLLCHESGRPLRMRALDTPESAASVQALLRHVSEYPVATNHPEYNPLPDSPGIGTGGTLTLEEASEYAGRELTAAELDTLNRNTSCNTCHNGVTQNPLRPPLSGAIDLLMGNGSMPPGVGVVDGTERAEALRVMRAAYQVELRQYFVGE